jgi:hypothetical protein
MDVRAVWRTIATRETFCEAYEPAPSSIAPLQACRTISNVAACSTCTLIVAFVLKTDYRGTVDSKPVTRPSGHRNSKDGRDQRAVDLTAINPYCYVNVWSGYLANQSLLASVSSKTAHPYTSIALVFNVCVYPPASGRLLSVVCCMIMVKGEIVSSLQPFRVCLSSYKLYVHYSTSQIIP